MSDAIEITWNEAFRKAVDEACERLRCEPENVLHFIEANFGTHPTLLLDWYEDVGEPSNLVKQMILDQIGELIHS